VGNPSGFLIGFDHDEGCPSVKNVPTSVGMVEAPDPGTHATRLTYARRREALGRRASSAFGPILLPMSTVAEKLRADSLERLRRMTPGERLAEALSLGQAAIATYAAAHGLDRDEARRRLERASQAGRRRSRVMQELVG
jgi:hypothetical protein